MNNNVVEKTLKSIDNIDRLSDLAAISIYNTSHEAIDKFDVMQEHATPEYVEGEFVQESLLTGVLIGAGIIGVAISAFLIIKKIIESKAKGDPNAASNTPEGADLTKPEDIQKLFDKWKTEYFNKYPDLVVENVKCADARQMSEYATLMTNSVNQFTDSVNSAVDEYMDNGSEEKLIENINGIAATIGGADISASLSSEGRIDQSTIGNLEVSAVAIAKSFKEFDGIIKNNIANFEKKAKEKNDKGTEEEGANSKVSEKTIKQFSDILKKKAEETGKIMVSFRKNVLGGFEAAIKAAANEKATSQTKQQTGNGSNGLTDEEKQRILNIMKVYYPEDEKQIIDEINVFDAAKSADELKEILDEAYEELKPGKGVKNAFIRIADVADQVAAHKHFDWPIKADDYDLDRLDSEDADDEADIDINAGGSGEGELKNQNTDETSAETETPETENAEKKDETETKQSPVDSTKNVLNDDALLTAYADKRFGGNKEQARQHAEYLQKLDAKTFKNNIMKQVFVNVLIDHKQSGFNEAIDDIYNNYMSDFKDANISPDESMNDINAIHLSEDEINKLKQIFSRLNIGKNFSDKHFCQRLADVIKDNSGDEFEATMTRLNLGFPPFNDIKDFKTEIEQNIRVFNKQFSDDPDENNLNNIQFTITNMNMEGLFNWAKQKYDTPYAVNRYELACKLARNALHLNDKFVPKPKELNGETPESEEPASPATSEGTPESATDKVPETQTGTWANGDNQTKDDNAEKLAKLDAMRNDQNAVNELKGQMTAIDGERPEQTLEIAFNHAYDSIRSYMDGTDTYDYIVSDEISQYQDDNTLTKSVIKKIADARFDNCNKVFNKLGLDLLSKPADRDIDTIINDAFTTYNITDSSTEIPVKTNETSNTKLFTDEEEDKMVNAAYAVTGLKTKFRQEIYNAVTDDGFAEAAKKLYTKYTDDANKLKQINEMLIVMAKSIGKEAEVPALPTTEATPTESETSAENQTPKYSDKGIAYDGNTIIINGKPITEKEWPDDYNETANKIISGLMKNGTGAGNAVSYVNDLWKTHCNGDMIKYLNRMYGRYKDLPEEQERFYTRVKEMAKVLGEPSVDQLPEPSAEYETAFVDGKPIPVGIKNNTSVETPEGTPGAETPSDTAPGVVTDNEELKKIADDLGLPLSNFIAAYDKVKEGNADYTESQMLTTVFNNQIAFNQFTLPAINEAIAKEYDKCKQVADAVHAPFDVEPITIDDATFKKLYAYFNQKNQSVSNMETAKLIPGVLADMVMDEMRSSEIISPEDAAEKNITTPAFEKITSNRATPSDSPSSSSTGSRSGAK